MFSINIENFLQGYKNLFGPLTTDLVTSITQVINFISQDVRFSNQPSDKYKIAYILATFKWETAHTFRPIDEVGSSKYFEDRYGSLTKVGKRLGNINVGDGAKFHGRGYVQLTGRTNYEKAGMFFNCDLLNSPEQAKNPELAYEIAIVGMIQGAFTGKKLSQFFKSNLPPNYDAARSIINGQDQHLKIADIARRFEELLSD